MLRQQNFPLHGLAEGYTKFELLKLQAVNKSSDVVSSVVSKIVIILLMFFAISILNIGLAIYLGSLFGELWMGFLAVGGFYLLLSFLFIISKGKWIKNPVNDILVKKLLN